MKIKKVLLLIVSVAAVFSILHADLVTNTVKGTKWIPTYMQFHKHAAVANGEASYYLTLTNQDGNPIKSAPDLVFYEYWTIYDDFALGIILGGQPHFILSGGPVQGIGNDPTKGGTAGTNGDGDMLDTPVGIPAATLQAGSPLPGNTSVNSTSTEDKEYQYVYPSVSVNTPQWSILFLQNQVVKQKTDYTANPATITNTSISP